MKAFRIVTVDFFLPLTVFEIQETQNGMLTYCQTYLFSQTHYCVKQVLYSYVLFYCQHAAVVSCCACEAPQSNSVSLFLFIRKTVRYVYPNEVRYNRAW